MWWLRSVQCSPAIHLFVFVCGAYVGFPNGFLKHRKMRPLELRVAAAHDSANMLVKSRH